MYLVLFSGFRGTHRPPAQPSDALDDNASDVHDEADFDIPDTPAVLERFMSNMSKLAADEASKIQLDQNRMAKALTGDRNFSTSCKFDYLVCAILFCRP
jgi:hypothetical protein